MLFSRLSKLVKTPDIVEELSWVEQYWPKPLRDDLSSAQKAVLNEHISARPEVSKFCLIGMGESYTDFHIDFGGTSVFYHVLWVRFCFGGANNFCMSIPISGRESLLSHRTV